MSSPDATIDSALNGGTASEVVELLPELGSETKAYSAAEWGWGRTLVEAFSDRVRDAHHTSQVEDLALRAHAKARKGLRALLAELADDRGMGWNDIATLSGVTVSAVRKWRQGGDAGPDKRLKLAELAAFLDTLSDFAIDDPASWMEIALPLPSGYRVRPVDLYRSGHLKELLDIAGQRRTIPEVLSDIDPTWRDRRSRFEVVDGADGNKLIQAREP
jgi:transcriptional regulator with XRE-family HTH domain